MFKKNQIACIKLFFSVKYNLFIDFLTKIVFHLYIFLLCRQLDYQASSPDEKALVEACAKVGFVYTGDDDDVVTVKVKKSVFRGGKV